ncbi:hypothetical protein XAP412_770036 [Xanthomonas phaseoli pv. phaseoli]|uniref:Secreted protein n=1 Tax=Xanthomonas campestris pv. phaseoli TaxID=317013 RepID=A0AB38E5S3_XANCH|nr:hypothetical protein XAP6984_810036 [Xanthomonas phaseoli pv. phaseoli]SON90232.1 hypothetical protein XAP412_770036 [Xanthomonas phaseoli pv. phaseoli]SON92479.1 hypothetical protein XAP7430_770037 [Xanthomonas phaseoli pv. phaseoli]SOO29385.1 hypothetical protein XAP6164_3300005 [Xanthomonas phaseoli pv. phaseoli]
MSIAAAPFWPIAAGLLFNTGATARLMRMSAVQFFAAKTGLALKVERHRHGIGHEMRRS